MIAKIFDIKLTKDRGYGLFAKKLIPKGTIVSFFCEKCKRIDIKELLVFPQEKKDYFLEFGYSFNSDFVHFDCDEAKHMNHSCNSNVLLLSYEGGVDIVVKDIEAGEEATYDYRVFISNNPLFKYHNMECLCGEPNCCRTLEIRNEIPLPLKKYWQEKINLAIKRSEYVEQPFKLIK